MPYNTDVVALEQHHIENGKIVASESPEWREIVRHSPNVRKYVPPPQELTARIERVMEWVQSTKSLAYPLPIAALTHVHQNQRRIVEGGHLSGTV